MTACCANWVRMTTRSSPSTHRKHRITAGLIIALPRCSVGRTKRSTTEHASLFTSRHSSFKALSRSHKHYLFSLQASHPDAWPGSPAPLNMNHYANKKSAAESMLDVALLMANASQLKAVLEQGPNLSFYTPIVTLISISLCLQVTVGVLLIFTGERIKSPSTLRGELHNLHVPFV